ncbi:hypothetical protein F444_10742 [Phytophthora nicotianae P1976]|uniref:Uncharacterized protein n=1 Tax=Phytophthora nicotianae P1976 TaxID=1317066 RepID=A0A081A339_PHYNI|nr:hypothetical protein F444_10742 [Phytophthora nicotianae P1976]
MSTIMVEQPRQSGMATPAGSSSAVKSQTSSANGTKEPASNASNAPPEPMDVDMGQREVENTSANSTNVVINGKLKAGASSTADATTKRNLESPSETSRKLVEQAKRRLQIQMQFVENARRKILDETHPDMTERLQALIEERDRLLHLAKQRSDYFQHGTTVIFDYECDEANSEYELNCEKLRQDMLEEIHHEMEILHDQRKGGHSYARTTTRKTRSTRNKTDSDSGFVLDTAQKIKKRAGGYVFQPLENKLGQSEIDHDVRELTSVYEATKKRRMEFDTGICLVIFSHTVMITDEVLNAMQIVRSPLWPNITGISSCTETGSFKRETRYMCSTTRHPVNMPLLSAVSRPRNSSFCRRRANTTAWSSWTFGRVEWCSPRCHQSRLPPETISATQVHRHTALVAGVTLVLVPPCLNFAYPTIT